MPGVKLIKWDDDTRKVIMDAARSLVSEGIERPTIREVLYRLLHLQGWEKRHYDTLTVKLGEWRDKGLIKFGFFSDDGAGVVEVPMTSREIAETIATLREMAPVSMGTDGKLHALLVEHAGLVSDLRRWLDYQVAVASSQGQLRREPMWKFGSKLIAVANELRIRQEDIDILILGDYDKWGGKISDAHIRWFARVLGLKVRRWGVTMAQVKAAGLKIGDDHQVDGWIAAYGPQKVKAELRKALHVGS